MRPRLQWAHDGNVAKGALPGSTPTSQFVHCCAAVLAQHDAWISSARDHTIRTNITLWCRDSRGQRRFWHSPRLAIWTQNSVNSSPIRTRILVCSPNVIQQERHCCFQWLAWDKWGPHRESVNCSTGALQFRALCVFVTCLSSDCNLLSHYNSLSRSHH